MFFALFMLIVSTLGQVVPARPPTPRLRDLEQYLYAPGHPASAAFESRGATFGDFDGDSDVDNHDYFAFKICHSFSGPGFAIPPACGVFDVDLDNDVDLVDLAAFLQVYGGSISRVLVEAGALVPIMASTKLYYSGEPAAHDNNALHGIAGQAGFTQSDFWYEWELTGLPEGAGLAIIANAAQPATAFRLQPSVLQGAYKFRLTVTNLFTFETGADDVVLTVISCQTDADCEDDRFCTANDVCAPDDPAAGVDGCVYYGSPCACTPGGEPCASALGDFQVCDEADQACLACILEQDCDDGIACTNNTCLGGLCIATPIHARCPQGLYCDKQFGCIPPP